MKKKSRRKIIFFFFSFYKENNILKMKWERPEGVFGVVQRLREPFRAGRTEAAASIFFTAHPQADFSGRALL